MVGSSTPLDGKCFQNQAFHLAVHGVVHYMYVNYCFRHFGPDSHLH